MKRKKIKLFDGLDKVFTEKVKRKGSALRLKGSTFVKKRKKRKATFR